MNKSLLLVILSLLTIVLFFSDLVFGSVEISYKELFAPENAIHREILMNFRLPKAATALLVGASLAVAGLLMQTLFLNPLAGPYVLGVGSGASLGVALFLMASGILPVSVAYSGWGIITAAVAGALLVLLAVLAVSFRIRNSVSLLIVGMMFGSMTGSIVSVLQNYSNPDAVKLFVVWTFGSLSSVTWEQMQVMLPLLLAGLLLTFLLQKRLNSFLLGENYARGLGVSVAGTRFLIIAATGILAGAATAFTGPIAFVGIAVPHLARGIFKTSDHKIILPASVLCGAALLLVCDIISQISEYYIPINAVSALFGAPLIIWIILKKNSRA